jgi:gamma-glutamyltranspeptidase/glutathione hydrolase
MPDAALVALREFGTMRVEDVLLPAVELAEGTAIDEPRVRSILSTQKILEIYPSSSRVFLPEGAPPRAGEIFRQPDLARTLRSLIEAEKRSLAAGAPRGQAIDAVRDAFYRGEIAKRIGVFSESNGGLLRADDFAAFRAKVEDAACTEFRGYTVCKPGFWTQGPAMLETLNILDGVDLGPMGLNSTAYIHQVVEALKLGYADRDAYYGDPDFVKVPGAALLSKAYGEKRRALIGENASLEFRPGEVEGAPGMHPAVSQMARADISDALMAKDTTCVTAIDKDGVMFSATPSGAWLPSVIAGDTGIPLTQRAQSFLLISGHPNELAPKKRPRVTLSPTLVTREGKPVLVMATPGGDNQDQSLLQVMLNILVFGSNAQSAVEAPRFQTRHLVSSFDNHGMMPGDLGLDERIPANVVNELNARGHKTNVRSRYNSGAAPVVIRVLPNGVLEAGADPYGHRSARAW